jgi:hypothetical protein
MNRHSSLSSRSRPSSAAVVAALLACHGSSAVLHGDIQPFPPCVFETTEIVAPAPFVTVKLYDINDQGVAIGVVEILVGDGYPCIWSAEEGVQLLPKPPGASTGLGWRINNNGWLGMSWKVPGQTAAYVYKPNGAGGYTMFQIPSQGGKYSTILGLNDLNQAAGVEGLGTRGNALYPEGGFIWSEETGKVQIQPPGWMSSRCMGISECGVIVGNVSQQVVANEGADTARAFILVDDELVIIEPPPPYIRSLAVRATASGLVAGTVASGSGAAGWIYEVASGSFEIWPPPPGHFTWGPRDMNDQGEMAGFTIIQQGTPNLLPCIAKKGVAVVVRPLLDEPYSTMAGDLLAIRNDGLVLGRGGGAAMLHKPLGTLGDIDCDGVVGSADIALLLGLWGSADLTADLDGDGTVGGSDLGILLGAWGQ